MGALGSDLMRSTDTLVNVSVPTSKDGHTPLKVEPLRIHDVPSTLNTMEGASADDPLNHYLDDIQDDKPAPPLPWRKRLAYRVELYGWIWKRQAFTVDSGSSLMIMAPPPKDHPEGLLDRIVSALVKYIHTFLMNSSSPERQKRMTEYRDKVKQALERSIAERIPECFTLEALCTVPAKQGRGYGSALVRHLISQADAAGRATWLISSNVSNTGFYESLGFLTVAEFALGGDNRAWRQPPVIIRIMAREARLMSQLDSLI